MANELIGQLESAALEKVVRLISHVARADRPLREEQSKNGERLVIEEFGILTDAAIVLVEEAQPGDRIFSFMSIIFETTSGTGRYRMSGANPSAAGVGVEIAAGGAALEIYGHDNIRNFRMIAETGDTLPFAMLVFM